MVRSHFSYRFDFLHIPVLFGRPAAELSSGDVLQPWNSSTAECPTQAATVTTTCGLARRSFQPGPACDRWRPRPLPQRTPPRPHRTLHPGPGAPRTGRGRLPVPYPGARPDLPRSERKFGALTPWPGAPSAIGSYRPVVRSGEFCEYGYGSRRRMICAMAYQNNYHTNPQMVNM